MSLWEWGSYLNSLSKGKKGGPCRGKIIKQYALFRACLAVAILAGATGQPGSSTAIKKVFQHVRPSSSMYRAVIGDRNRQGHILGQGAWQQAVGLPQCQMRFGSNEKVTIIMVAGLPSIFMSTVSSSHNPTVNLGHVCMRPSESLAVCRAQTPSASPLQGPYRRAAGVLTGRPQGALGSFQTPAQANCMN